MVIYHNNNKTITNNSVGRPIQWGAFASTTTNMETAKSFTNKSDGVLFKINITSGKDFFLQHIVLYYIIIFYILLSNHL